MPRPCWGRVKLLYTAHKFFPAVGGTELVVLDLASRMVELGHDVTVVTSDEPGSPADEVFRGIKIKRIPLRRVGKFRFPPGAYTDFVTKGDWDVIHVHGQRVWSSDYLFKRLPRSGAGKVFTAHGFHQWHMFGKGIVERWYYERHLPKALRAFDRIIALTTAERDELVGWGVDASRIVIVPGAVNAKEFETRPPLGFRARHGITKKHMLLYVGGFYDNKRVDQLVEAASLVKSDAELVVIGRDQTGGALEQEMRELAKKLDASVRFLGQLPREEVVQSFFEADLFLLASQFEGYGIVLLETMAAGVPFVATPAGGAPDLAELGAGVIARDAKEMASEIDRLLALPDERARMGATGRAYALQANGHNLATQHQEIYEQAKKGRKTRAS